MSTMKSIRIPRVVKTMIVKLSHELEYVEYADEHMLYILDYSDFPIIRYSEVDWFIIELYEVEENSGLDNPYLRTYMTGARLGDSKVFRCPLTPRETLILNNVS